jgi:predicted DNA-binding transcriptional regulator AlpA
MAMELPAMIISAPVKEFSRISGLGESTIWAMIHDGRLESIAIGRRRLVLIESYRRLIEQQRAAPPRDARRNSAVPPLGSKRRGAVPSSVTNSERRHLPDN